MSASWVEVTVVEHHPNLTAGNCHRAQVFELPSGQRWLVLNVTALVTAISLGTGLLADFRIDLPISRILTITHMTLEEE